MKHYKLADDGVFPNNERLPLLFYQQAVPLNQPDNLAKAAAFETLFATNQWPPAWRNGVFGFHHYHSTAHEALGIYAGGATLQFGGERGPKISVKAGDVVIIPAGVAHKNCGAGADFAVVGAYPRGQRWDTCYGKAGERPRADENIAQLALPPADPVFGRKGGLTTLWLPISGGG